MPINPGITENSKTIEPTKIYYKNFTIDYKELDKEDRVFEATITSSTRDRDNEVILAEGVNFKNYIETNPIVLLGHNSESIVGKTLKIHKYKNQIIAKAQIIKNDVLADKVWNWLKEGVLKGVSIGYQILGNRQPSKKDYEDFGREVRNIITKAELLEFSLCAIPCNTEAMVNFVQKQVITNEDCKKYFGIEIEVIKEKEVEPEKITKIIKEIVVQTKAQSVIDIEMNKYVAKKKGQLYI